MLPEMLPLSPPAVAQKMQMLICLVDYREPQKFITICNLPPFKNI